MASSDWTYIYLRDGLNCCSALDSQKFERLLGPPGTVLTRLEGDKMIQVTGLKIDHGPAWFDARGEVDSRIVVVFYWHLKDGTHHSRLSKLHQDKTNWTVNY
jgi:hypothetical protein